MKNILNCCIIEDEPLAQDVLESFIAKVPFLHLSGIFSNPLEAFHLLENEKPELLFLDINLPEIDGLSFIPMLNFKPSIILTTAYDQYALKGFELDVVDYLLKPFSFERFYKSVSKVFHQNNQPVELEQVPDLQTNDSKCLFLKVGHRIQKIVLDEILFIQGMKDYLQIHTSAEKIMVLMNFSKMVHLLPNDKFVRVHKSFIVSVEKIDHIERNRIVIGKNFIPISETYSEHFFQNLKGFGRT